MGISVVIQKNNQKRIKYTIFEESVIPEKWAHFGRTSIILSMETIDIKAFHKHIKTPTLMIESLVSTGVDGIFPSLF